MEGRAKGKGCEGVCVCGEGSVMIRKEEEEEGLGKIPYDIKAAGTIAARTP